MATDSGMIRASWVAQIGEGSAVGDWIEGPCPFCGEQEFLANAVFGGFYCSACELSGGSIEIYYRLKVCRDAPAIKVPLNTELPELLMMTEEERRQRAEFDALELRIKNASECLLTIGAGPERFQLENTIGELSAARDKILGRERKRKLEKGFEPQ